MIPVGLIVLITVVDIQSPTNIHLGPLLVIAPALTPSLGGPRLTAFIGGLAVAAQVLIAVLHGGLGTSNHIAQIIALTVLSTLIVVFTVVRDRRSRQLARAQSVAEAAQRALLRPLPDQIGPLRIASMYLSAEDEAQIGGDLYSATRTGDVTRVIIGDVRGKGLAAVGESALVLNAFRLISPSTPRWRSSPTPWTAAWEATCSISPKRTATTPSTSSPRCCWSSRTMPQWRT